MYDDEKIGRLQNHIAEHPHDAEAVIALLKARSDAIAHDIHLMKVDKLKRVAKVREEYEKSEQ